MAIRDFMAISKALADENRVRILAALQAGELCICQIIELLQLAPSTVSKHLAILKQAHLIEARKEGRWIYCRLAQRDASKLVRDAIFWVRSALAKEKQVAEDARRLKAILKMNPEALCCQQREASKA